MKNISLKDLISRAVFLLFLTTMSIAQVGIGNTDPKTQLDVEGALSLREGSALNLSNGLNSNVSLGTTPYSLYRITGPTSDFSIRSIIPTTDADGQMVTLINTTTQDLTIVHDSGSGSRRIYNPAEVDIIVSGRYSTITLQYNTTLNKWLLISFQNAALASDDWGTSGNAGTTAGTNFLGTTDGNALSIFTDNTEKLRISIGGHFRSFTDGDASLPMFSWDTDRDTGFFRSGDDILNFTTGGVEFLEFFEGSDDEVRINDTSQDINFRVESDDNANMLFVEGNNNSVGIGTNTPNGALEVFSATNGVVFPRVALTRTNIAAPVVNPNGGALAPGTTVFNTNATTSGTNDVYVGKYYWDGSRWVEQFSKHQAEKFEQNPLEFRTSSNGSSVVYQNIPNLTGQSFTADYTGVYKIEVQANFGAGYMDPPSSGDINVGTTEGYFDFTFNGTSNYIYAHSYSAYNDANGGSAINYYGIWNQSELILYISLTAGQTYNFNLSFDQFEATDFVDNGDSGTGRGYVGYDIPCYVEFTYLNQ